MSHKQNQPDPPALPIDDQKLPMSRRDFLKASAASAVGAGFLAACGSVDGTSPFAPTQDGPVEQGKPVADTGSQTAASASQANAVNYATQVDTWVHPWEWVQYDWPGEELHLNVVSHAAPVAIFGNIGAAQDANVGQTLFSYSGISPGPTIRVRGDDVLHLKVRNLLGPNDGLLNIPASLSADKTQINYSIRPDYCRPIHSNHKHQIRTTNIHTHGLHVRPYLNPDGKNSDNIFLRIVPPADYELRQQGVPQLDSDGNQLLDGAGKPIFRQDPDCWPLKGSEILGEADFEYRLGTAGPSDTPGGAMKVPMHPPGTHWYHPHPHGATFTQVASGMAGLLIVEGDVDEMLKAQLDPTDEGIAYRERPFVIQRIFGPTAVDVEAGFEKDGQKKSKPTTAFPAVNGQSSNHVENFIVVQPNVVERWRVLNAAVDGQGFIDFFVLDNDDQLRIDMAADSSFTITWQNMEPIHSSQADFNSKMTELYSTLDASGTLFSKLRHLASDGITLVTNPRNPANAEYTTRKVTKPFMLAPANRADFLFQAPDVDELTEGSDMPYKRLSVWVRQPLTASDNPLQSPPIQKIATIIVRQLTQTVVDPTAPNNTKTEPIEPPAAIVNLGANDPGLNFPPVPDYLLPISNDEVTIGGGKNDPDGGRGHDGMVRSRHIIYSGWGGAGFPAGGTQRGNELNLFAKKPGTVKGDISGALGGQASIESMMIDCRKFNDDPETLPDIRHHMLLNTAEEWTVSNLTMTLMSPKPPKVPDNPDQASAESYFDKMEQYLYDPNSLMGNPVDDFTVTLQVTNNEDPNNPVVYSRTVEDIPSVQTKLIMLEEQGFGSDPRERFMKDQPYVSAAKKNDITTKGVDHPFHIHINPFWVTGLYDWAGNPLNWNYEPLGDEEFEPRWHDVIRLPRSGGYVKFRSRFWDYVGEYVNHCHILQHEDNGMMQGIAVVQKPEQADYIPLKTDDAFPLSSFMDCYTMNWGIADLVERDGVWVAAGPGDPRPEKDRCDTILQELKKSATSS